jgi:hypothetical protein
MYAYIHIHCTRGDLWAGIHTYTLHKRRPMGRQTTPHYHVSLLYLARNACVASFFVLMCVCVCERERERERKKERESERPGARPTERVRERERERFIYKYLYYLPVFASLCLSLSPSPPLSRSLTHIRNDIGNKDACIGGGIIRRPVVLHLMARISKSPPSRFLCSILSRTGVTAPVVMKPGS